MKTCLECGTRLIGREDKKFCNDSCRNAYNNKINKDSTNLMRNTNNQLRKNYRILSLFNENNTVKIPTSKLIQLGFDFQLFTSIHKTKSGNSYFFVYDQGYKIVDAEFCILAHGFPPPFG